MAKRGKSAREKGAAAEREFFAILNLFLPENLRLKRELGQARDGGADGKSAGVLIEVKRQENLRLYSWLEQARKSAENSAENPYPVVAFRRNHGQWRCIVELSPLELAAFMRSTQDVDATVAEIERGISDL
jgi:hypothetical protein